MFASHTVVDLDASAVNLVCWKLFQGHQNPLACFPDRVGLQLSDDEGKYKHTVYVKRNKDRTCPLCCRMLSSCLNILSHVTYASMGFCKDLLGNASLCIPLSPQRYSLVQKQFHLCLHSLILSSSHHKIFLWKPQATSFLCHFSVCHSPINLLLYMLSINTSFQQFFL